jgi:hypothetical protein
VTVVVDRPLRLVPAPVADPPYDDPPGLRSGLRSDRPDGLRRSTATQGALALTWVLPSGVDAVPGGGPETALATPGAEAARTLPDVDLWARRLSLACVEVLTGTRPAAQLRRWTSDEVYALLRRSAPRASRVAEPRRRPPRPPRVVLRTVRVCEVGPGVAEVAAVVDDGTRARALALRMEGHRDRWRCTRFERV